LLKLAIVSQGSRSALRPKVGHQGYRLLILEAAFVGMLCGSARPSKAGIAIEAQALAMFPVRSQILPEVYGRGGA
jgi:hypothetical protein